MTEEMPGPVPELPPEDAGMCGQEPPITSEVPAPLPAHPPRPRIWTAFVMLVLAFLANGVAGGVYLFSAGAFTSRSGAMLEELSEQPDTMITMVFWSMLAMGIVTWLGALASPVRWRERVRLTRPGISAGQIVAAAVGATTIGIVFTMCDALGLLPHSTTLDAIGQAVSGALGANLMVAVLVIGFMPGLIEELLFRGYIQTRLSQRWGIRWSVLVTALLFAVYHLDFSQGLLALVMGVFLGAVTERASSIIPAMIAHMVNNSFAVLLGAARVEPSSEAICWAVLAVAVVVLMLCAGYLRRRPLICVAEPQAVGGLTVIAEPETQIRLLDPSQEGDSP